MSAVTGQLTSTPTFFQRLPDKQAGSVFVDVAIVDQRIGATVIQQEVFLRKVDLEHVENWDSRHSLQPRILHLAFPHHLASQHDLAHQHGLAVHPEKKTLVHFACEMTYLTHYVRFGVNLIVGETVQSCHEIEQR